MRLRERLFALEYFGIKLGLDTITLLLDVLGRPDRQWPSVHIAGTNGKGSVAAMVERGLRAAGYRTGRYTSPHLDRIEERIAIAGEPVSSSRFDEVTADVLAVVDRLRADHALTVVPTFFESSARPFVALMTTAGARRKRTVSLTFNTPDLTGNARVVSTNPGALKLIGRRSVNAKLSSVNVPLAVVLIGIRPGTCTRTPRTGLFFASITLPEIVPTVPVGGGVVRHGKPTVTLSLCVWPIVLPIVVSVRTLGSTSTAFPTSFGIALFPRATKLATESAE